MSVTRCYLFTLLPSNLNHSLELGKNRLKVQLFISFWGCMVSCTVLAIVIIKSKCMALPRRRSMYVYTFRAKVKNLNQRIYISSCKNWWNPYSINSTGIYASWKRFYFIFILKKLLGLLDDQFRAFSIIWSQVILEKSEPDVEAVNPPIRIFAVNTLIL